MAARFLAVAGVAVLSSPIFLPVALATQDADDPVYCLGRAATIVGSNGDDVLKGTKGDDVIAGLDGTESINGSAGNDTICGGDNPVRYDSYGSIDGNGFLEDPGTTRCSVGEGPTF